MCMYWYLVVCIGNMQEANKARSNHYDYTSISQLYQAEPVIHVQYRSAVDSSFPIAWNSTSMAYGGLGDIV